MAKKKRNAPKVASVHATAAVMPMEQLGISCGMGEQAGMDMGNQYDAFSRSIGCISQPLATKNGYNDGHFNDQKPAAIINNAHHIGDVVQNDNDDDREIAALFGFNPGGQFEGVRGTDKAYAQCCDEVKVNAETLGVNNDFQPLLYINSQCTSCRSRADDEIQQPGKAAIKDSFCPSKQMLHKSSKGELCQTPLLCQNASTINDNLVFLQSDENVIFQHQTLRPTHDPTAASAIASSHTGVSSFLEQRLLPSLVTISLEEWIRGAIGSSYVDGVSSSPYLMATLKIASLLTEEVACIHEVENSLIDGSDWANHIHIGLEYVRGTAHNSFPQERDAQGLNYLQIHSAEILSCEKKQTNFALFPNRTHQNEERAIYFLGLIFYKLFSGGECPSPNLYALASADKSFESLSKMSLMKQPDDDHIIQSVSKHHKGSLSLCHMSCEYLAIRGVPGPLCNLILNMIECVYGDLKGKDCYSKLNDISSDLNLITEKPTTYLRCLESDNLFSTDLESHKFAISRDDEFAKVKSSYDRCMLGSRGLAIIKGESGSGKSWLAHRVGMSIIEDGGIMLVGKFDQLQTSKPFSALACAFDMYCDILIGQKGSEWATVVVSNLQTVLNGEACRLEMMIPKLRQVLDYEVDHVSPVNDQNCQNITEMNHFLLSKFIEVITTFSKSVTLCLDDVQWADEASVAVLNRLLRANHNKFFFIGCCRSDEMSVDHQFWRLIKDVSSFGICATTVELTCIEKNDLNEVISEAFCILPRLVKPLSTIIHQQTQGNPLFFVQLLLSLYNDGLIQFDFRLKRYVWDTDKIASNKLPDGIAMCFTTRLRKLPFQVQYALNTFALFGSSVRKEILSFLEESLNIRLTEHLEHAKAKGFISFTNGSYNFGHDRIQEASFHLFTKQIRDIMQSKYGRCLIKHYEIFGEKNILFLAMSQINAVDVSIFSDINECLTFANCNLAAGKSAMSVVRSHIIRFCSN